MKFHSSRFDLRKVENVVDQGKQVTARIEHALERFDRLFGPESQGVLGHHLGETDDGVERRAQFMTYIGEELRFVLARLGELPALVLDFVEQPHILDRDHRLVGEGLDQLDLFLGERVEPI